MSAGLLDCRRICYRRLNMPMDQRLTRVCRAPELEGDDDKPKAAATGESAGVSEDDVKLVVAQTGCTEEKAREALKEENGDLINASECGAGKRGPHVRDS